MRIDGKAVAKSLRASVGAHVDALIRDHGIQPALAVVLVGDDPASAIYVSNKEKAAEGAGIKGSTHRLPAATTQFELLTLVRRLNAYMNIYGILVQLPLPRTSTDCISTTRDASPPGCPAWCPARRWAV